jgi:hypothetical protein
MPVIYKTLFEVKLMHEYYLTREDGSVIFEKPDQPGRLAFLEEEFEADKPAVNDDISFEFPESLKQQYDGLCLKLLPSWSGCRVVVRVTPKTLADQSVVYTPLVSIPDDLNIYILLLRKNGNIDSCTNARVSRSCPSLYFFSNLEGSSPRSFPFLTNKIAAEDSSVIYEQGELSISAANKIQSFYRQAGINVPQDIWTDVAGDGFANESDRLLLPEKFDYSFGDTTNITQAGFKLKDNAGNELVSLVKSNAAGIGGKTGIDFSGKASLLPLAKPFDLKDFIYTLEVSGDNGYTGKHAVIFSNELAAADPWAVVNIRTAVTNTAFNLFANDGFIIRRMDSLGAWTPAPVFEIPVKSRLAYWRFISNRGNELNVAAALNDYVDKEGKVLVTKKPRVVARHWFLLSKEAPPGTVYVPNPEFPGLKLESDRRLFFDIRVPQSELFPEV